MKINKIIIWSIISIVLISCNSENYRIITRIDRDGSCQREIHVIADTISDNFPYDLSYGWKISQTDTVVKEHLSEKIKKVIKISKKFNSAHELFADLRSDIIFPNPKESLKKRFRWFYTYYAFTAVYPEVTDKGRVPMEQYLNKEEQKLYLQGDMSAYRGMNGTELKEILDELEIRFWKWYSRSVYEECFDIILNFADTDFRSQLSVVKDSLYFINAEQIDDVPGMSKICTMLDNFLATDHFSKLYAENEQEMDDMIEERTNTTNELYKMNIQYELALPGKIMTANTDLQNDGVLEWNVNLFKFLADDYTLTAESRVANIWAFVVTLLLVVICVCCFVMLHSSAKSTH